MNDLTAKGVVRPGATIISTDKAWLLLRRITQVSRFSSRDAFACSFVPLYDPRALEPDGPTGVLHAKAVVADNEAVFVTSANLTEAALDRNIEIGLLFRDRALAALVTINFYLLPAMKLVTAAHPRPSLSVVWIRLRRHG